MKKTIALLALALTLCCLLAACDFTSKRNGRSEAAGAAEKQTSASYSVYLDFDFEKNLFMAIYDIEIYLDDEYIGVIEHGKAFTKQIEAEEGRHTFTFYKETDNSISATKKCDINMDCTVKCTLHSNTSSIEIKKFNLREGITGSITMPKVVEKTYKEAKEQLEKAGFSNIAYRTPNNASIWSDENWTVVDQSVEPGAVVDKNVEIILSCEKPGYHFEDETEATEDSQIASTENAPMSAEVQTEPETGSEPAEPATSAPAKTQSQKLEEFMEFVRATVAKDKNIQVEVKQYLDTVYLDVTMDGMTEAARNVIRYGGDYRTQWNYSMEKLRALNQQYRDVMIDTYGLKYYNFSLCLMNDEDPDYVLAEFVNGELKRSVVE